MLLPFTTFKLSRHKLEKYLAIKALDLDKWTSSQGFFMIGLCPLASGSKGNCVYLGSEETKVLIDCGMSGKAIGQRLEQIGVSINEIEAILVTHEHGDHIRGLKVLAGKHGIEVFANHETAKECVRQLGFCPKFKIFSTGQKFVFKDLLVEPFSIPHDTVEPVAFSIESCGYKLGICTDLGFASTLVQNCLENSHCLYVESNHHIPLVQESSRPYVYKQRVLSRSGHLSNEDCGRLLQSLYWPKLEKIYLAHLSSECNTPELALSCTQNFLNEKTHNLSISIAEQDKVSEAFLFKTTPSQNLVL